MAIAFGASLMAQEVMLTYENHAFITGRDNEMHITDYVEPGPAGPDVVWDLSVLKVDKELLGTIKPAAEASEKKNLSKADVVLNEFGNKFFFKVNNRAMELHGMESGSGKVHTTYEKPFVKMVYPFKYGDHYSGDFAGTKHFSQREVGISGTYTISADGYGKLILPGGKEYKTLRVKTIRKYQMDYSGSADYEIVSHRWYINSERYPVAVVQTINTTTTQGKKSSTKRAAYKYPAVEDQFLPASDMVLYPNPVRNELTINYKVQEDAEVMMELFDQAGKKISTLVKENQPGGNYTHTFSTGSYDLNSGTYLIRTTIGDKVVTKSFVKQ